MLDPRVLACQIENNKFIELCFDVKVWLLGLAQLEKIPIIFVPKQFGALAGRAW